MRAIIVAVCLLLSSAVASSANQVIYNVDLSSVPTEPGTGGQFDTHIQTGAVGAEIYGTITPVYLLSALGLPTDSEVNLGTLTVYPLNVGDQYGDEAIYPAYFSVNGVYTYGTGGGSCNIYTGNHCADLVEPPPLIAQLIFPSTEDVQLTFVRGFITAPPDAIALAVPEASTWAMLLIGFAGIGYFIRQRRLHTGHL